jgi:uncharacterized damage-inducible protein DinB
MRQFSIPQEDEYPAYLKYYINLVKDENDIIEKLQLQAKEILALIESTSDILLNTSYAEGKWTIAQLVIHLIDTERIFCTRALCFARGEKQSLPGYKEDDYVSEAYANERSKESLLEEYIANRISTLSFFKGLSKKAHMYMGEASGLNVSVRALLYAIAGHETHHLNVLKEKYLA